VEVPRNDASSVMSDPNAVAGTVPQAETVPNAGTIPDAGTVPSAGTIPNTGTGSTAAPGVIPPTGRVCFDFLKGCCDRTFCKFPHVKEPGVAAPPPLAPPEQRVCFYFLQGKCYRNQCFFLHTNTPPQGGPPIPGAGTVGSVDAAANRPPPTPFRVCFNFQKGQCFKEVCEYAHVRDEPSGVGGGVAAPRPPGGVCRDFLNGNCNRAVCRFPHVYPDDEGRPAAFPPPAMSGPPPPFQRAPPPPPIGGSRSAPSPVVAGHPRASWKCENIRCLFVNPADESPDCCLDCGTPRPAYRGPPPPSSAAYGVTDRNVSDAAGQPQQQNQWRCLAVSCGNMNYEWRQMCNRCKLPRPPLKQAGLKENCSFHSA